MDDLSPTLMISALQHYAYCPRQFALIHVEQAWSENYYTAHGQVLHKRVDSREPEHRRGVRFERSVAVRSAQYRLSGQLDLLEIEGDPPKSLFPVEYKRGKPKVLDWDRIQVCAQALCLEEMRNISINEAAIWYWEVRKRESIEVDAALRASTIAVIHGARELLAAGRTPPPTDDKKRCRACSLVDLCEPEMFRHDHSTQYLADLFSNEETS